MHELESKRAMAANDNMVPIAEATLKLRLNREQVIRRIQSGKIAGGRVRGYWYVERGALYAAHAAHAADAASTPDTCEATA